MPIHSVPAQQWLDNMHRLPRRLLLLLGSHHSAAVPCSPLLPGCHVQPHSLSRRHLLQCAAGQRPQRLQSVPCRSVLHQRACCWQLLGRLQLHPRCREWSAQRDRRHGRPLPCRPLLPLWHAHASPLPRSDIPCINGRLARDRLQHLPCRPSLHRRHGSPCPLFSGLLLPRGRRTGWLPCRYIWRSNWF